MFDEKHYSVQQLAEQWGMAAPTVRDIFEREPGVIRLHRPEARFKRKYCTMRIPESAVKRVYEKITRAA